MALVWSFESAVGLGDAALLARRLPVRICHPHLPDDVRAGQDHMAPRLGSVRVSSSPLRHRSGLRVCPQFCPRPCGLRKSGRPLGAGPRTLRRIWSLAHGITAPNDVMMPRRAGSPGHWPRSTRTTRTHGSRKSGATRVLAVSLRSWASQPCLAAMWRSPQLAAMSPFQRSTRPSAAKSDAGSPVVK
jgi:hypothetical protein